ncbi:cytochrome P450 2J2-like isoform X1 [Pleurodeles waltl]|uniref:cytochrome P450 2J2-like isoform X1 n=1 Tax=Pleurodeles waltl TaxID=8319 RepID=UPI00370966C5
MLGPCEGLLILAAFVLIFQFVKLKCQSCRLPPGPPPLPLIGNLWTLNFQLHYGRLMQLAKTYGNVYTLWVGHMPFVVLNGYDAVRNALVSHSEELSGRPVSPFFMDLMGEKGVILTSGHTWQQQRRFDLMTFRNLGLGKKGLEHRIQDEAQHLLETLTREKGNPIDPSRCLVHTVCNVISCVVFGRRFHVEDPIFQQLLKAIDLTIGAPGTFSGRMYDLFPQLMRLLPGPLNKVFQHYDMLLSFIMREVKTHRQSPEESLQDFIAFYLDQISKTRDDPSSTYTEDNMVQMVADLFITGTETTTTALRWALLYMVVHPIIQGKVQQELDTIIGPSQEIKYEDRKKLPYTNAVIHEILRYGNIVSVGLPRLCLKDTVLQGFPIKKGTIILPNLSSVLYDPECWETPQEFNPCHFLDHEGNFINREAFLPFSAGQRMCLGEQMAKIEFFIIFTSLLHAFTFRLPEGVKEARCDFILLATLQPHPYKICAIPRKMKRSPNVMW